MNPPRPPSAPCHAARALAAVAAFWLAVVSPARAQEVPPPVEPAPQAPAPESPQPEPQLEKKEPVYPDWLVQRLKKLHPDRPEGYFDLGEEVADLAADEDMLALARRLFAFAYELDRRNGKGTLAASACVALARLERSEQDRRWLLALAGLADTRYALPDWSVAVGGASDAGSDLAFKTATLLGLVRSGDGIDARRLYADAGIAAILREYERLIGVTGAKGALFRLKRAMDQWPCPECKNQRVVAKQGPAGPEYRLCNTCRGNPGPVIADDELVAQLRFESMLLSGIQRSWAAQIVSDQGTPLRDPDPDELAPTYKIDAKRAHWRGGEWIGDQ